jgi:hypothetical protein
VALAKPSSRVAQGVPLNRTRICLARGVSKAPTPTSQTQACRIFALILVAAWVLGCVGGCATKSDRAQTDASPEGLPALTKFAFDRQTYHPARTIQLGFEPSGVELSGDEGTVLAYSRSGSVATFRTDGTMRWKLGLPDVQIAEASLSKDGSFCLLVGETASQTETPQTTGYLAMVGPGGRVMWERSERDVLYRALLSSDGTRVLADVTSVSDAPNRPSASLLMLDESGHIVRSESLPGDALRVDATPELSRVAVGLALRTSPSEEGSGAVWLYQGRRPKARIAWPEPAMCVFSGNDRLFVGSGQQLVGFGWPDRKIWSAEVPSVSDLAATQGLVVASSYQQQFMGDESRFISEFTAFRVDGSEALRQHVVSTTSFACVPGSQDWLALVPLEPSLGGALFRSNAPNAKPQPLPAATADLVFEAGDSRFWCVTSDGRLILERFDR